MSIFTNTERICLYIANLLFWAVVCAVVDSQSDAVSMFFGSIVVSHVYIFYKEGQNEKDESN